MNRARQRSWHTAALATALLLWSNFAHGQDVDRLLPDREVPPASQVELPGGDPLPQESGDDEQLIENLRGVDLEGEITVPRADELRHSLQARVGQPLTTAGLLALLDQVVEHYEAQGFPVVDVLVPEQEITDGRVLLEVVEGTVGDVALAGGERLNAERIARQVRLITGERLKISDLQHELDWLNRNPFHDARLVVSPGDEAAEADLLFQLSDDRPWRVFGGFENSGVDSVGEERFYGGFEWGNAFGIGHRLTYQATLGTDIESFRGHALDYRIPFDWQHELDLLGAIVNSETTLEDGTVTGGTSWVVGGHYIVPLQRRGDLRQELSAGFEFKSTDNNLEFGGTRVFDSAAELAQFVGRYRAALDKESFRTAIFGEAVYSPGDFIGANSDEDLQGIRADAVAQYSYLRAQLSHAQRLPANLSLVVRAGAQWSDAPLLPSEMLALGGYDRVRGYEEREGLGDKGYWGSMELRVPVIESHLQVLAFLDYGYSELDSGAADSEFVAAGPGVRYRLNEHASLRFDYGWQLDGGGSRGHIGVQVEF